MSDWQPCAPQCYAECDGVCASAKCCGGGTFAGHAPWCNVHGDRVERWQRWFAAVPIKTRDMGWIWMRPYWVHRTEYWGSYGHDRYVDKARYATPLGRAVGL